MIESANPRVEELRRILRERGNQLPPNIQKVARIVLNHPNDELTHEQCLKEKRRAVQAVLQGKRLADAFPAVRRHLDSCQDCAGKYADLLDISLADDAGKIKMPATTKKPDLRFLHRKSSQSGIREPAPGITLPVFVKPKVLAIVNAIAATEAPALLSIVDTFFKQLESLGGRQFAFERGEMKAMGLGADELTTPVATLAVTYSATLKLVDTLSLGQVDTLVAQDALGKRAEELALLAALELNVKPALAKSIAKEFAALVAAEPETLRELIEREKH